MSDNAAILIRALEASGSDREAALARAILGDPAEVPAAGDVPAAVAEARPEIGQALPESVAPSGERAPASHGGQLTRADVSAMSADEINDRWDEVQAVLEGGQ